MFQVGSGEVEADSFLSGIFVIFCVFVVILKFITRQLVYVEYIF